MKRLGHLLSTAAVLLLIAGIYSAKAAEFTADMLQTKAGKTSRSKLYVKDTQYRMDIRNGQAGLVILVNRESRTSSFLWPDDKQYIRMSNTGMRSLMANPVESFRYHADAYESLGLGREAFKGYDCSRVLVKADDQDLFTAWVAEELDFPLKILFHPGEGMSMELDNITPGPVEPGLFAVPADYTVRKDDKTGSGKRKEAAGPERKAWMDKVRSAEVLKAPLEKEMQAGEIIRLKIEKGKAFDFFSMHSMRIYAFDEGEPVAKARGATTKTYFSPVEAGEMVIYFDSGDQSRKGRIRVRQGDMPEQVLSAGEEMRVRVKGDGDFVCRFVNVNEAPSTVSYTWLAQGEELPESEIGPESFRTKEIKSRGEAEQIKFSRSMNDLADALVVKVLKGKVLVKAGQPFQPKRPGARKNKPPRSNPLKQAGKTGIRPRCSPLSLKPLGKAPPGLRTSCSYWTPPAPCGARSKAGTRSSLPRRSWQS